MKQTILITTSLVLMQLSFTNCNGDNKTANGDSESTSEEGVVVIDNNPNNYYYQNVFRTFDEESPEYLKWKDTLTGKPIIVDILLESNPEGRVSYLPMLDKSFNKYKFWGYLYSQAAENKNQPCMIFKFDIEPSSPKATDLIDNFKGSEYELVWDSKAKKTFNHDKRIDNILKGNESCYSGSPGRDFLTIIVSDKYFDDLNVKSSQTYACLLNHDKTLAEDYKAGNFYTIRFGDEIMQKETIDHSEHFYNIDIKGSVSGNYLQVAKVKATIEEVNINRAGMLVFKLKDSEIIELKSTSSLDFLMTLNPKIINVDSKKSETEANRINQAINDLNPDAQTN